jgi:predicted branched-subunit amino acid permease
MTSILHRLALGMGIAAFIVVAVSSSLAGASPTGVVTRGVAAFVAFGVFGLVALRGIVLGVLSELAKQGEERRQKDLENQQKHDDRTDMPLPE